MKILHTVIPPLLLFFLISGCTSPRLERELKDRPFGSIYVPHNIFAVEFLPAEVQRVAILPFTTTHENEDLSDEVEPTLIRSIRREGRFEVIILRSEDFYRLTGRSRLPFQDGLPEALVTHLQTQYGVDAVLQTEITAFRPYKPMLMGIHSRLFQIPDGTVLWTCDEVFDAGNEKVVLGARKYAEHDLDQPFPLQTSYSTLLSPQRFAAYVGWTLYQTIPSRQVDFE